MNKTQDMLERADENMRDARVDVLSPHGRLRAAYDAAVFCALAVAEANRIDLNSEDPEEILGVLSRYLGHAIGQDVTLLSQLHRKTDYETAPFLVTDPDAKGALQIANRIQEAVTSYIHKHEST